MSKNDLAGSPSVFTVPRRADSCLRHGFPEREEWDVGLRVAGAAKRIEGQENVASASALVP